MEIIRLGNKSVTDISRLENECFSHPWSEQSIVEAMAAGHIFIGAVQDGKTVGYAGVNRVCGEAYIDNIAVTADFRRRGIGRALCVKICEICRSDALITLEVRKSNTAAIRLYQSLGFENEGLRRDFYTDPTEDAVIMTKRKNDDIL